MQVLGAHCSETAGFPAVFASWFRWLFDGGLGVRTFFLISGFLITWLMLKEVDASDRVDLWYFYVRRGLRILPVYVVFLLALVALGAVTPYRQATEAWVGNLTFTTNFVDTSRLNWTSGHLWSLAVEEQFYLIWPGLFGLAAVAANRRRLLWMLGIPLVIAPLWRVVSYMNVAPATVRRLFGPYSFFNYFDSIAIGCICAVVFARERDQLGRLVSTRPVTMAVLAATMILIPHLLNRWLIAGIVTVPLGPTLQAIGVAILVLQSLMAPTASFYRILNWPSVARLGVLSYSIYIWQEIFCTKPEVFGLQHAWWLSFPGWLAPVLIVSLLSYFGLERPFLKLRAKFRQRTVPLSRVAVS